MLEYGGLEELMLHAKQKYPGDLETQGKYATYFINKMKEKDPDVFKELKGEFDGNVVILTPFPDQGQIFYYWELYTTRGVFLGNGVEKSDANISYFSLIFSSVPEILKPIVPLIQA